MWLLDRGCDEDALATLQRIAAVNKQESQNMLMPKFSSRPLVFLGAQAQSKSDMAICLTRDNPCRTL